MFKKSVSVILAIAILFSVTSFSAFAADGNTAENKTFFVSEKLKKTVNEAAAALVGTKNEVSVSDALLKAVLEKAGSKATKTSVEEAMKSFTVLDIGDFPEDIQKIAESAEFQIRKGNVVYIVIELDKNPELLDVITLCRVSQALCELQSDFIAENGRDGLRANTYIHILGELALHCAVYSLTKSVGAQSRRNPLHFIYEHARKTELNQTEIRGYLSIRIIGLILSKYFNSKV